MRERFQARKPEESACAFDRVNEAEDVIEDLRVVWFLLETHELDVDGVEAFIRLSEEFAEQVVHWAMTFVARRSRNGCCLSGASTVCCQIA